MTTEEYRQSVAEEITTYLGLKTKVDGRYILVDTIAGEMKYECAFYSEGEPMRDVFRLIMMYGYRLQRYGMDKHLEYGNQYLMKQAKNN